MESHKIRQNNVFGCKKTLNGQHKEWRNEFYALFEMALIQIHKNGYCYRGLLLGNIINLFIKKRKEGCFHLWLMMFSASVLSALKLPSPPALFHSNIALMLSLRVAGSPPFGVTPDINSLRSTE